MPSTGAHPGILRRCTPGRYVRYPITVVSTSKYPASCLFGAAHGVSKSDRFSLFFRTDRPSQLARFEGFTLATTAFWTSRGHRYRPFFPPVLAFTVGSWLYLTGTMYGGYFTVVRQMSECLNVDGNMMVGDALNIHHTIITSVSVNAY